MSPLQRVVRLGRAGDGMGEVGFHSPARVLHCPHMHQRPLPNTSLPLLYPLWVLISWSCAEKFLDFGLVEGGFLFFGTGCSKPIIPRAFSPPWVYLKTKQNTNLTKVQMQTKSMKLMQNIYRFSNRFCYLWAKQSYNLTYSIFNLKIIQKAMHFD